ncbi:MAG: HAMP domain-containing protein [Deltaproteobacteria bacterium]|nr:HAMP domain-containing protein [Deltaproteobacteria bacterium]
MGQTRLNKAPAISLRVRLLLLLLTVTGLLVLAFAGATFLIINQQIESRIHDQFKYNASQLSLILDYQAGQFDEITKSVMEDGILRMVISLGLSSKFQSYLDRLQARYDLSFAMFVDHDSLAPDSRSMFLTFNRKIVHPFIARSLTGLVTNGFTTLLPQYLPYLNAASDQKFADNGPELLVMMAASPIADDKGRIMGVFLAGRILDRNIELIQKIKDISGADCALVHQGRLVAGSIMKPLGGLAYLAPFPVTDRKEFVLPDGGVYYIRELPLNNYDNQTVGSALILISDEPFDQTRRDLYLAGLSFLLIGMIISFIISFAFARKIVAPIRMLGRLTYCIAEGVLDQEIPVLRKDEIGNLAMDFNTMVRRLAENRDTLNQANERLLHTAHQAGMAELAVSVLHNIGNALNAVNYRVSRLEENITARELESLEKIYEFLKSDITIRPEGERGRWEKLLRYFEVTLKTLKEDFQSYHEDLGFVRNGFDHVMEVIALQQKYAGLRGLETVVDVNDLLKDAAEMVMDSIRKRGIELEYQLAELPPLHLDKNKMIQVLINIIKNAYESLSLVPPEHPRKISLNTERVTGPDGRHIKIVIADTGTGVSPDSREKVFRFNFSTKGRGSGFGLHDSANYIKAQGGTIALDSDGPGQGAQLIINLPIPEGESR